MNFLKCLSIRTQLLILGISTGIIVISLIMVIYFQVNGMIAKNNIEYTSDMSFQIRQSISRNCDLIERILTATAYNRVVQSYMMQENNYRKVELFKQVDSLLMNMQALNDGVLDFILLGDNGNSYFFSSGEQDRLREIIKNVPQKPLNYYTEMEVLTYERQKYDCFIVVSDVYSIDIEKMNGEKIGVAAVVFNAKVIGLETNKELFDSINKFYLLDRENVIYSGNDPSRAGKKFDILEYTTDFTAGQKQIKIDEEEYIATQNEIPEFGGKIISITPKKDLYSGLSRINWLVVRILVITGSLLLVLFIVIINNILKPLNKFIGFITLVKTGNLKTLKQRVKLDGYVEIGIMAAEFNNMLDEIDNLTHRLVSTNSRLYEAELEKKQSELAFLKSQINPHFLYNTLESMRGMAGDEGALRTMDMARALGVIFRYCVKGEDMVTIREELDIVKSYVKIQQIRFDGRFDVLYNFTEDILECHIQKMILQPIVENAVSHGLEEKYGKGCLQISGGFDRDGNIRISVSDDGAGIDNETLADICRQLSGVRTPVGFREGYSSSIGLMNVHDRIRLIYGPEYGITIDSVFGEGTAVVLKFPSGRKEHV